MMNTKVVLHNDMVCFLSNKCYVRENLIYFTGSIVTVYCFNLHSIETHSLLTKKRYINTEYTTNNTFETHNIQ